MKRNSIQALRAVVAVAITSASLAMLPSCTMVRENVTGVQVSTTSPTDCVRACDRAFLEGLAAETKRSLQNLEACKALPTLAERDACVQAELARYKAAVQALYAARTDCINNCHTQGTVSGG
jgi:hypothetical protein